jgi:putative membrane protein (TIGR04086 family)
MGKTKSLKNNVSVLAIVKGSLVALVISLVCILFFAFIIKLFGLTDGWIKPINQVIKAVSILIGVFFGLKKDNKNGLVKGLLIGLVYTILAFVVFSILNGGFDFDKTLLTDVLFGAIMGAICGVIAVNTQSKKYSKA